MRNEAQPAQAIGSASGQTPGSAPETAQVLALRHHGGVRYARTCKGELELRTRRHPLSPRARQLLLLVDSRRDFDRLARVFANHELTAYLALLQAEGLIQLDEPVCAAPPANELESLRDRALNQLLTTLGSAAEHFALRIAKCRSRPELETLVPAMESVVEVCKGKDAARKFTESVLVP
ncbi:MAG: hypothetical protein WA888_08560 [Burkholderiaceae bacterium]